MSSEAIARFRSLLEAEAGRAGLELTKAHFDRLQAHYALLEKWNRAVRLIGTTEPDEVVRRHTLESLALVPFVPADSDSLLDIGSGNGFPAIPVKCVLENLRLVMMEPVAKKVTFLEQVIATLAIKDASVLRARIDKPGDLRGETDDANWDCITMRAVAAIPSVMRGCPDALRPGGRLLVLTGESGRTEIRRLLRPPLELMAEQRLPHMRASYIVAIERSRQP